MDERNRSLRAEGEPALGTWPVTWDEAIDLAGSGASGELVAMHEDSYVRLGAPDHPDGSEEWEMVGEATAILRDRLIRRGTPRLGD